MARRFQFQDLPPNWVVTELAAITPPDRPIIYGIVQAGPHIEGGVPYLRSTDVGGEVDADLLPRTSEAIACKYRRAESRPGDLVFSLRGNIGETSIVPPELPICNLTQGTARIAVNSEIDVYYLRHALASPAILASINAVAKGSTFREISIGELRKVRVPIPPLGEQRTIAARLNTWYSAIGLHEKLIDAKHRFKRGLLQQLLSGKRRVGDFTDAWTPVRLVDVVEVCNDRNGGRLSNGRVMAVTKAEGIVPMRERTIAADITRYSVVTKNCFAYNPMRLNIGSIARWTGDDDVLVSPDYVVFRCKEVGDDGPGIDPDFLDQLRRSSSWERFVRRAGNGSVRVRIYFSDLARMKLMLPSLPEQRRIAAILNSADHELGLLNRELDALKRQKRGLMQKLLTGQVRVAS